ncbi:Uu.00g076970.m01.CDS01 [Anthostomella pinea]|uniref:Uu.00g076970.m01.CDS01 n=1 Tax=Anthostomella pinea TaxID=933095 RepID=A0AAI8VVZ3_9PEZI|nr:Uu.00g076970.m01.CDS01 [Anthostomella pinea]
MSYPPSKRQRSNTSREAVHTTPQTQAPALRQAHVNQVSQINPSLGGLYSPGAYTNGGYAPPPSGLPTVNYGSYAANPVTSQHNGYGGGYQNSSTAAAAAAAAYGAGPYSPQQQAHAYNTTHYPQPQPSPQLPSHNGHYPQAALNGVQNGGYPTTHTPQPGTRGPYSPAPVPPSHQATTYHQPQPRNPTAAIQHAQHPITQYGESFSSQPSSHATAYHTNATPYPEPTVNHTNTTPYTESTVNQHYSPAPLPTPQHDDRPMSEDPPENDDEDAQGETADESTEVYTSSEPARTSIPTPSTEHSKPPENKCACKKGRGKKKAYLTTFFGTSTAFPKPCGANACFATWLSNQPNIEELDMDLMVDMLLDDDASWVTISKYTAPFKEWEQKWKKTQSGKGNKKKQEEKQEERERLEFELLRGGLGNCNSNDFNGFWYSFCQSKWVPMDLWEHCQECRVCKPSAEWHCDKHDRCTNDRVCSGCAAAPFPEMMYPESGT